MKVRLTQPGWENYTGQLGIVNFVDGLSTEDVPRFNALRISATLLCEGEDGSALSLTQEIIDKADDEAPIMEEHLGTDEPETPVEEESTPEPEAEPGPVSEPAVEAAPEVGDHRIWTQAELEAIADEQGIKGVRQIADSLDIRSNSIAGLINEMIAKGFATKTVTE